MLCLMGLVGVLAVAAGAGGPDAASARPADCISAGRTIDAGPGGRVYRRPTGRVYLCSYQSGRRTAIGWDDCFNALEVRSTRFSGRFLAVGLFSCNQGGSGSTLDLRRTRDGRRIRRVPAVPGLFVPGSVNLVTDLVLRGNGVMAWMVELRDTAQSPPRYQVRASERGTGSTLLAEGADIAPGSLALAVSTLYWIQSGLPRSATL